MALKEEEVARSIKKVIEEEILMYKKYLALLLEEKKHLKANNSIEVNNFAQKRLQLTESMLSFQESRLKIMREFTPEGQSFRLRDWIKKNFSKANTRNILPIAENLFEIITEVRSNERDHSNTVNFAIKMFNGLSSIIRSASNNIIKSYSRKGHVKESYNPQTRTSGVIKEV